MINKFFNITNNTKEGLNVLVVGNGENIDYINSSKFLRKLYTTSSKNFDGVINIKFNTFKELAKKCKTLQIDLVIVEEEKWINEGIADVLQSFFINCIAATTPWTKLSLSRNYSRSIMEKYNIDVPPITLIPTDFPLFLKGDGVIKKVNSIDEVIKAREEVFNRSPEIAKTLYLEKILNGEVHSITALYDRKHLFVFPDNNIPYDILQKYIAKIEKMLSDNKADFIGYINSDIILFNNTIYNIGFSFSFKRIICDYDILYILWLAVYQKLNEIIL